MGRQLTPFDKELHQRADEVLHYLWDPIGVSGVPQARDEYDGYLAQVFGMLVDSKGKGAISSYLVNVEEERMGLTPSTEQATRVEEVLLDWLQVLQRKYKQ
jgi:hypothetical protein